MRKPDSETRFVARLARRGEWLEGDTPRPDVLFLQNEMPEADPVYATLSDILKTVPSSRWTFARVQPDGRLVSLFGSNAYGSGLIGLARELKLQRANQDAGPRIAPTRISLNGFANGMTLIFADARATYGILILSRTADLGLFTSSEIDVLTFALDTLSEHLHALRLQPLSSRALEHIGVCPAAATSDAFYVLDRDLNIVLTRCAKYREPGGREVGTKVGDRLPDVLENTVRALTSDWSDGTANAPGISRPVSFLVVRTYPLSGPNGLFIGVSIDRFRRPHSLTSAAIRFHISPREIQVLALLFDGDHLDEIADRLHITSSTVQDHIKNMLDKSGSRNRSELLARVLGWEQTSVPTL